MSDQVSFANAHEVHDWMAADDAVIVDVREQNEWDQARIPGAVLMPLSTFDPAKIPDAGAKHLVFHCKSGVRCGMAAHKAIAAGYKGKIARLEGGILGWMRAGYEVE